MKRCIFWILKRHWTSHPHPAESLTWEMDKYTKNHNTRMWFIHLRHKFVCKNPDVSIDLKKKAVFRKSREIACPANGKGWTRKQRRIDEWLFAQVVPISPRFRVTPYDTPGVLFIPPALCLPRYVRLPSLSVCGHDRTVGPTRLEMVVVVF